MSDEALGGLRLVRPAGRAVAAGQCRRERPLRRTGDPSYRGMSIFACDPAEAARLSDGDPSVVAGRLFLTSWSGGSGRGRSRSRSRPARSATARCPTTDPGAGSRPGAQSSLRRWTSRLASVGALPPEAPPRVCSRGARLSPGAWKGERRDEHVRHARDLTRTRTPRGRLRATSPRDDSRTRVMPMPAATPPSSRWGRPRAPSGSRTRTRQLAGRRDAGGRGSR